MSKDKVKTITCPKCEHVWPYLSEQYIVLEEVGQCYSCFVRRVASIRDERTAAADYMIDNCSDCLGIPGARAKCIPCGGKGWVVVDEGVKLIALQ